MDLVRFMGRNSQKELQMGVQVGCDWCSCRAFRPRMRRLLTQDALESSLRGREDPVENSLRGREDSVESSLRGREDPVGVNFRGREGNVDVGLRARMMKVDVGNWPNCEVVLDSGADCHVLPMS